MTVIRKSDEYTIDTPGVVTDICYSNDEMYFTVIYMKEGDTSTTIFRHKKHLRLTPVFNDIGFTVNRFTIKGNKNKMPTLFTKDNKNEELKIYDMETKTIRVGPMKTKIADFDVHKNCVLYNNTHYSYIYHMDTGIEVAYDSYICCKHIYHESKIYFMATDLKNYTAFIAEYDMETYSFRSLFRLGYYNSNDYSIFILDEILYVVHKSPETLL